MRTATSMRYEKAHAEMQQERLLRFPYQQAEAIANHYVRLATLSLQLKAAIDLRRQCGEGEDINQIIDMLVQTIKTNHLHDFGIELEWKAQVFEP